MFSCLYISLHIYAMLTVSPHTYAIMSISPSPNRYGGWSTSIPFQCAFCDEPYRYGMRWEFGSSISALLSSLLEDDSNFIFEPGMEKTGLKGGGLDDLLSLLCNFERYLTMCLSTAYHKDLMLTRLIKKPYSVFLAADNSNLILPKFHLFCYRRWSLLNVRRLFQVLMYASRKCLQSYLPRRRFSKNASERTKNKGLMQKDITSRVFWGAP